MSEQKPDGQGQTSPVHRQHHKYIMNTRFLLLIGMAGILYLNAPAKAQYQVYPADARIEPVQNQKNHKTGPAPAETSLFYCLPQNDIKIKVVLQKTTYTRGLYSDYAEQMLKLPAFPDKQESYRIERIELHTEAIPDPTQVFCVQGARLPKMDINPDGILLSVNRNEAIPPTGPHPAFQPQEAPGPAQASSRPEPAHPNPIPRHPRHKAQPNPHGLVPGHGILPVADMNVNRRFDTIIKKYPTDTSLIIEKILQPVMDQKSLSEQARKMADKIFKIQADQADLLSGMQEVAYPSGTMRFMYQKLEDSKRQLIEYFTGTFRTETIEYEVRVQPQNDQNIYCIAYFSPESGLEVLDPEEQTQAFDNAEDLIVLQLQTRPGISAQAADFETRNRTQNEKSQGFRYRIPAKVEASLNLNGEELDRKDLFIAQWGRTLSLPIKDGCKITLDPQTGALRSYEEAPTSHPLPGKPEK